MYVHVVTDLPSLLIASEMCRESNLSDKEVSKLFHIHYSNLHDYVMVLFQDEDVLRCYPKRIHFVN